MELTSVSGWKTEKPKKSQRIVEGICQVEGDDLNKTFCHTRKNGSNFSARETTLRLTGADPSILSPLRYNMFNFMFGNIS